MMRKTLRITALFLVLIYLFSASALAVELEGVNWDDLPTEREYNLTYDERNYEHPFALGEVMITLKQGVPDDTDFAALFPELDIVDVEVHLANKEGERIWLVVTLSEKTRESVIEAIELLKSNPVVYLAAINAYIFGADETVSPSLIGDANCDGAVANDDLILVARHIVGLEEFNGNQRVNADIDIDNEITNADLIAIAKMIVSAE